jgi:hypothetical protein
LVELADTKVEACLREEEGRKNWFFIPKEKTIEEARGLFSDLSQLEALFITETGKPNEELLGIVTR